MPTTHVYMYVQQQQQQHSIYQNIIPGYSNVVAYSSFCRGSYISSSGAGTCASRPADSRSSSELLCGFSITPKLIVNFCLSNK